MTDPRPKNHSRHHDVTQQSSLSTWVLSILAVALVAQALHYYPLMPDPMASHFGVGGVANGSMPRFDFFFAMISTSAGISAFFVLLPRLIIKLPAEIISLPHKDYWLSEERRPLTMRLLGDNLKWIAALFVFVFNGILRLTCEANLEGPPLLYEPGVFVLVGGLALGLLAAVIHLLFAFRLPRG